MTKKEKKQSDDADAVATSAEPTEAHEQHHEATAQDEHETPEKQSQRLVQRLRTAMHVYTTKKKITLPATVLFLLIILAAIPYSRYTLLGFFVKEDLVVTVVDSRTNTPVSKATVTIGGHSAATNASGQIRIHTNVGYQTLAISKQYYQAYTQSQLVALSHNQVSIKLVAVGRLVPVKVTNKLTGKPVAGATVKALNSEAITESDGTATVVLPVAATTQQVTISAKNYNTLSGKLLVTDQKVSANSYAITPAGKLYFLSNFSGKIDVVKTDLDGTNRQTVLAGTGSENKYNTVLLASRDWKYLALYAQRKATGNPEIDLIDTSTDKMSNIDEGNASFSLVGWTGDRFVYRVDRNNVSAWQNGQQALKSFDAQSKKITVLAQTAASGSGPYDYVTQSLGGIYILDTKVVYALNWYKNGDYYSTALQGKQATLNSVNPDGTGSATIKGFGYASDNPLYGTYGISIGTVPYEGPNAVAVQFSPNNGDPKFYKYENGKIAVADDLNSQNFYANDYSTYLLSPSGSQTFWSIYTDGKNNLKVGNEDGQNAKDVASESDYSPYGWFTDDYLLVQKSGSELYIMPANGSGQPFKISNYYKPQVNYRGYGGGYGGI